MFTLNGTLDSQNNRTVFRNSPLVHRVSLRDAVSSLVCYDCAQNHRARVFPRNSKFLPLPSAMWHSSSTN
jgi:hypothetical protein